MHMLYITLHVQLCAQRHITCSCFHQWRLFGKEGILNFPFRSTGRQSEAFTLQKMSGFPILKGLIIPLSTSRKCCEHLIMHEKKILSYTVKPLEF